MAVHYSPSHYSNGSSSFMDTPSPGVQTLGTSHYPSSLNYLGYTPMGAMTGELQDVKPHDAALIWVSDT